MSASNLLIVLTMPLFGQEVLAAKYCGTINGQEYWNEIAGRTCADMLKEMTLSKEHIDTTRKGQAIESITGMGNFLQQQADDKADKERQERLQNDAADNDLAQNRIRTLALKVNDPIPIDKIKKFNCNTATPGMGLIDPFPSYDDPYFKNLQAKNKANSITVADIKSFSAQEGKQKTIDAFAAMTRQLQQETLESFNYHIDVTYVSKEYVNAGNAPSYKCDSGALNANLCEYIYRRWAAKASGTITAIAEKCLK